MLAPITHASISMHTISSLLKKRPAILRSDLRVINNTTGTRNLPQQKRQHSGLRECKFCTVSVHLTRKDLRCGTPFPAQELNSLGPSSHWPVTVLNLNPIITTSNSIPWVVCLDIIYQTRGSMFQPKSISKRREVG